MYVQVAVTFFAPFIVTVHVVDVPVHPPLQLTNLFADVLVAESVTIVL